MRKLFVLFFVLYGCTLFGQEKEVIKPKYVIIANNEIITEAELNKFAVDGLIKNVNNGVSQKERDQFAKKFGNKIGDKEFIIKVEILTEKEKLERANQPKKAVVKNKNENELKLNIGDPASDFTVQMIDGKNITLSHLKGKVVLVNYLATWCAPCLMEFTEIPEKILQPFKGKDFVLIPISIAESKEKVEKKMQEMKKYGVTFNVGIDPTKKIWDLYATGSIPKNFVIDKKGVVRYVSIGNPEGSVDKLAAEIKKLLAE